MEETEKQTTEAKLLTRYKRETASQDLTTLFFLPDTDRSKRPLQIRKKNYVVTTQT